ncbi:hypothetical protein L211DRAFT_836135 [Terfezia boudieri ATCC MYA-4762]|uniref:Uncharacterized protein n=1 Tax=Terfezia boudieri ATCC MYA-4762 TaxID=1051890 RepID=A0A3N4LY02_9PEZI|nr:hypothetical protein L211DRAFT_836135 [Terfezia boudieri ATCC MYA-4762]
MKGKDNCDLLRYDNQGVGYMIVLTAATLMTPGIAQGVIKKLYTVYILEIVLVPETTADHIVRYFKAIRLGYTYPIRL